MGTIDITRVEDVRAGDVVTLSYRGHEFSGVAWNNPDSGGLNVGDSEIKWYRTQDGPHAAFASFVRATREVPDEPSLPTEPTTAHKRRTEMNTVEITRVEDIRRGDRVTLTRNGTAVSGTVGDITHGDATHIDIPTLPCVLIVGDGYWTLVGATRKIPALPTERGSVITKATIRGEAGHAAFLDDSGQWRSLRPVGGYYRFHDPEHITYWEPGRIVPNFEFSRAGVEVES